MVSSIRIVLVALSLSVAVAGCCFGGGTPIAPMPPPVPSVPPPSMPAMPPGMPTIPGMVAPGAPLPGAGMLPAPPLSFAGVEGVLPIPGAPPGAPGEILTSGTATVRLATGSLPGVASGTVCSYAQFRTDTTASSFPCRWNVTCGTNVVYGLGTAGYQVCSDPMWPPGVLMMDPNMTGADGDGMFIFNAGGITIGDDTGPLGAFNLTMTIP